MDMEKVNRFVELTLRKRTLDAEKRRLQVELDQLEPVLADQLIEEGINSIDTDDGKVYVQRKTYVGAMDKDGLIRALIESKMLDCLNVGTQRLGSIVREGEAQLPSRVAELLKISELYSVSVRKP